MEGVHLVDCHEVAISAVVVEILYFKLALSYVINIVRLPKYLFLRCTGFTHNTEKLRFSYI